MCKFMAILAGVSYAFALGGIAAAGEHHGGGHHEEKKNEAHGIEHGGKAEEVKVPENYADAVAAIEKKRDACAKLIEDGKLDKLHGEGEGIKKIAESLAKLASKEDSGVAKADIKTVNLTAKDLAAKYGPLDEAGDNGKKEEAKKVLEEMSKLIVTLKTFVKK